MDQLLTPRGLVLTLASFFGRGVEWLDPVRLRARGSCWCGCCFCLGRCVCAVCFVLFFLCGDYLTLALFWGRFGLLEFVVG